MSDLKIKARQVYKNANGVCCPGAALARTPGILTVADLARGNACMRTWLRSQAFFDHRGLRPATSTSGFRKPLAIPSASLTLQSFDCFNAFWRLFAIEGWHCLGSKYLFTVCCFIHSTPFQRCDDDHFLYLCVRHAVRRLIGGFDVTNDYYDVLLTCSCLLIVTVPNDVVIISYESMVVLVDQTRWMVFVYLLNSTLMDIHLTTAFLDFASTVEWFISINI